MVYDDDREEIYVERGGTGVGTILGVILAIVVVLAIIWFFFLGGMNGSTSPGTDTNQPQIQEPAPADNVVPNY